MKYKNKKKNIIVYNKNKNQKLENMFKKQKIKKILTISKKLISYKFCTLNF